MNFLTVFSWPVNGEKEGVFEVVYPYRERPFFEPCQKPWRRAGWLVLRVGVPVDAEIPTSPVTGELG